MSAEHETSLFAAAPVGGPWFSWSRLAIWLPGCAALGVVVGGAAANIQRLHFAPLILFPLIIGALLGLLLTAFLRISQSGHRPTVLLGLILAVGCCVWAEHYFSYLAAVRAETQLRAEKIQEASPQAVALADQLQGSLSVNGFLAFLQQQAQHGRPLVGPVVAHGLWVWASWAGDALLLLIATLAVLIPAMSLPYCDRCETWYHPIRSGRLNAEHAARLGEMLGAVVPEHPRSARFRLLSCRSGCGPTELELIWRRSRTAISFSSFWLSSAGRNRVMNLLDEVIVHRSRRRRAKKEHGE